MDKQLYFYFCTEKSDPTETDAYRSIRKLIDCSILGENSWGCTTECEDSLATVYNKVLASDEVIGKILVLIHDDITMDDLFVADKLNTRFSISPKACVVGIAGPGTIQCKKHNLYLWHLIGRYEKNLGSVANKVPSAGYEMDSILCPQFTTTFGPQAERSVMVDGCFMAIDVDRVRKLGVTFDEKCPARYHFYDLIFSLKCFQAGGELYVDNIHVVHRSPGLTKKSEEFMLGNSYFENNYMSKICG